MGEGETGGPIRAHEDLANLRRSVAQSHFRTQRDLLRQKPRHRLRDYVHIQWVKWVYHYLKTRVGFRHRFVDYDYGKGETGIYRLTGGEEVIRVSLAADWGTGTSVSQEVAQKMTGFNPHYTIHLGDVYYVGTKKEVRENFISPVKWPRGADGSLALNGNHEMYALGKGYFTVLLDDLKIRDPQNGKMRSQKVSFFCLENDFWRIIGLDTGYNSVRKIPALERLIKPGCKLPKPLVRWLRDHVKPSADRRGLVLLSHHQYYSAFEDGYEKPARQLAELIGRPVLWFWGHEHRLAIYGKYADKKGIEAYGRCIGHGGMPIEGFDKRPKTKKVRKYKLVTYDGRRNNKFKKIRVGFNGFANLKFRGRTLTVEYQDDDNQTVLRERWEVDLGSGALKGLGVEEKVGLAPKDVPLPDLTAAQR